jgi:hypothetical protein
MKEETIHFRTYGHPFPNDAGIECGVWFNNYEEMLRYSSEVKSRVTCKKCMRTKKFKESHHEKRLARNPEIQAQPRGQASQPQSLDDLGS